MKIKENLWVAMAVIVIAVISRLIPHYPNLTALGAAALFGGAYFYRRFGFLIPLIALFISDLLLNNLLYAKQFPANYDGFVWLPAQTLWTYGAFILIAVLGKLIIREGKLMTMIGASLGASVIFFLITNFAVWLSSPTYPDTIAGLSLAYIAGIPFFWNTLVGDLFFVAVFFGGYELVKVYLLKKSHAPS